MDNRGGGHPQPPADRRFPRNKTLKEPYGGCWSSRPGGGRKIRWATLDLSGAYRAAYQRALPNAVQIADPFHVVRLANLCLDRVRRRVQEETLGHRGRKGDDLYRIRKLLTLARERLHPNSEQKLTGLLQAGDPRGEVRDAWHAKKPSGESTKPTIQAKATNTPACSPRNSKTNHAHPNSTNSDAPSTPGIPRSSLGITPE